MTLRKQVVEDIKSRLRAELGKVHMEINSNRYQIKKFAERQTVLKREVKELYKLLRSFPLEASHEPGTSPVPHSA